MEATTKPCVVCGKTSRVTVPLAGYIAWRHHGEFVQNAFPEMSADNRELLISGTHPACWAELFNEED